MFFYLHALYQGVGLKTAGQGIAFSLPVDDVVGLSSTPHPQEPKHDKKSSPTPTDTFVEDRKGHDMRYAIDPTKIHNDLGWLPETKFEAHNYYYILTL